MQRRCRRARRVWSPGCLIAGMVKLLKKENEKAAPRSWLCVWLFAGFCLLFGSPACWAQKIALTWDTSSDGNVSGYVLYYGTVSGNYTSRTDLGTNTMAVVSNLNAWTTYYFAVTDYNFTGVESPPSSEIIFTIPATLNMTTSATPGASPTLTFPVAAGHSYEILATSDLKTWTSISTTSVQATNGSFAFQDPAGTAAYPQRFYRVVLH